MAGRFCKRCGCHVRPVQVYEVNHVAHILFTLITCSLWLPFWFMACVLSAIQGFQCPHCGGRV